MYWTVTPPTFAVFSSTSARAGVAAAATSASPATVENIRPEIEAFMKRSFLKHGTHPPRVQVV